MTLAAQPATRFTYREVTLHERLREVAREVGSKPALVQGDRTLTYAELDAATDRLAGALARGGAAPGGRATLFVPDTLAVVLGLFPSVKGQAGADPHNAESGEGA